MKKLTSFTKLSTGVGMRIAYTYSEINSNGELMSQNNKGNFIVVNDEIIAHLTAIEDFIENKWIATKVGE